MNTAVPGTRDTKRALMRFCAACGVGKRTAYLWATSVRPRFHNTITVITAAPISNGT